MENPKDLTEAQLKQAQETAAAVFMSAYVHRMARAIGVDDSDFVEVNAMAIPMIEPLNLAMECCWRATMKDASGLAETMGRFRKAVEKLSL